MSNNIPISQIQAVIFDMDELMVNSAAVHKGIFEKVLNKYGASLYDSKNPLRKDEETQWFGWKIPDIFAFLIKKYQLEGVTVTQLNDQFNEFLLPTFGEEVEIMPGTIELVNFLKGKYKLAVASSAPQAKIDIVLKKLGVTNAFAATVSGEDRHITGKPAPDIFLTAAKDLHVEPANTLVLEDAKNGVEAAKSGGMYCIGVHNKFTLEMVGLRQDLSRADLQVNSLLEVLDIFKQNWQ